MTTPAFLPVSLCLHRLPLALIGRGRGLAARYKKLKEAGATSIHVYGESSQEGLVLHSDDFFFSSMPTEEQLRTRKLVMAVDLHTEETKFIVDTCAKFDLWLNVEDIIPHCDFYFMSTVRRGDLVLAAGTAGAGPTLAVMIREFLEQAFPRKWENILKEAANLRLELRAEKTPKNELIQKLRTFLRPHIPVLADAPPTERLPSSEHVSLTYICPFTTQMICADYARDNLPPFTAYAYKALIPK